MAEKTKHLTNIYLIDEHRIYLSEITERFQNPLKYVVESFTDISKFVENISSETFPKKNLHLIFMSIDFEKSEEEVKKMLDYIAEIKRSWKNCEVLILSPKVDTDLENKVRNMGALAMIQKNENAILRITNYIKGIISERNLEKERKASLFSIKVMIYFLAAVVILTLLLFLVFPDRFYL
jgi:DNA-binding NarL/FixJ family response regulator